MPQYLHVGGLVAVGFDPTGRYLLTVSHAGRGVFEVGTWQRVARDTALAYPDDGHSLGIGPIEGMRIPVAELNYDTGKLSWNSPDGTFHFEYESGTIDITDT
jgi:hypothetical protein